MSEAHEVDEPSWLHDRDLTGERATLTVPAAVGVSNRHILRRLPLGRYRMMHWLCRRSTARFVARFPGSALDLRFECDLRNGLAREVFFTGCYEPPETMLIRQLVDPGGTFVDVGAHWGYFSLMMAEHVGSTGRVVAVEADPRIYAILERNFALNDLPQVRLVCAAAAAESGRLSLIGFDERGDNWGTSRIVGGPGPAGVSFDVPARGLDDLLDEFGVDTVDLIKIDIEGGEALALAGMSAGLRRGRYRRLLLELHPAQLAEHGTSPGAIIEGLLAMGYRGWVVAHAAAEVRRAAYAQSHPVESLLRPLRWPEPLDAWPHLVFALDDISPVHRVPRRRRGRLVIDDRAALKIPHITSSTTRRPAAVHEDFEPIMIVGHPRSGTTLLATILNRHSQVAIPPELSFFLPAHRQRRRAAVRAGSHKALLDYARSIPHCREIAKESAEAMFMEGPPSPGNLFRCMLIDYAHAQGKPRCGEKSPWHLLVVPELMAIYPRAKFLWMIRDGRDVVRSCRGMPFFSLGAGLVALPDLVPIGGIGRVLPAAASGAVPDLPVRGSCGGTGGGGKTNRRVSGTAVRVVPISYV